jgi:predicted MFS family arabinose efflux permease
LTMIVLGAGVFGTIRPFRIISMSLLSTAGGLILCGLSENLIMLIVGRMICGVGFGMIILPARQFIVDNSSVEKRAYHLAGYTTAFSGGLFSSIVIGGIIADYFSYRTVFFFASAVLLLVLVFAYLVFSDQPAPSEVAPAQSEGLRQFMSLGLRDQKLLAVMFQGVITRIMLLGFYYYSIPIFLRVKFTYADIGRIMMFYGLTTIFFASFLNRYIKELKQSKNAVVVSNLLLGAALFAFYFLRAEASVYLALTAIGGLIILALSNCFTFPSQINLLLDTDTVKEIGHRVPMAVNEAFMRIGSALGPLVFGYFATYMDIQKAIGLGGVVCLAGNILFMFFYRGDQRPRKEEDLL